MPLSNDYAHMFLEFLFAKVEKIEPPENIYIGLCTNDPEADNGTFNELSGGGYHRVLISRRGDDWPDYISTPSNRYIINQRQINWTKATAPWDESKGYGLFGAPSGGSPFYYARLDEPYPKCDLGAVALFDPMSLKISFPNTDLIETSATVTTE